MFWCFVKVPFCCLFIIYLIWPVLSFFFSLLQLLFTHAIILLYTFLFYLSKEYKSVTFFTQFLLYIVYIYICLQKVKGAYANINYVIGRKGLALNIYSSVGRDVNLFIMLFLFSFEEFINDLAFVSDFFTLYIPRQYYLFL